MEVRDHSSITSLWMRTGLKSSLQADWEKSHISSIFDIVCFLITKILGDNYATDIWDSYVTDIWDSYATDIWDNYVTDIWDNYVTDIRLITVKANKVFENRPVLTTHLHNLPL